MGRRLLKQFFVVFLFLLAIASVVLISRLIHNEPEPTCSDGIMNQKEQKVDCGGPCQPCEWDGIDDLQVLQVKILAGQNGFYDLVAQIKNPNQNYGSGNVLYHFALYDINGVVVDELEGATFIMPNQTKYLLNVKVPSKVSVQSVKLLIGAIDWQKNDNYRISQFVIQNKEYRLLGESGIGFSQAKAIIKNESAFDFAKVDIDVLLFDNSHKLIAVGQTDVRSLLTGQSRDFLVTWFNKIETQVSSIEVEAETNFFDADNYVVDSGSATSEPFQKY